MDCIDGDRNTRPAAICKKHNGNYESLEVGNHNPRDVMRGSETARRINTNPPGDTDHLRRCPASALTCVCMPAPIGISHHVSMGISESVGRLHQVGTAPVHTIDEDTSDSGLVRQHQNVEGKSIHSNNAHSHRREANREDLRSGNLNESIRHGDRNVNRSLRPTDEEAPNAMVGSQFQKGSSQLHRRSCCSGQVPDNAASNGVKTHPEVGPGLCFNPLHRRQSVDGDGLRHGCRDETPLKCQVCINSKSITSKLSTQAQQWEGRKTVRSTIGSSARRQGPADPLQPAESHQPDLDMREDAFKEVCGERGWPSEAPDDDCISNLKASITTRWKKATKLPTPEQERTVPPHSSPVDACNIPEIRKRMSRSVRARFDEVWNHAMYTDVPTTDGTHKLPVLKLWEDHAKRLVADSLASVVDNAKLQQEALQTKKVIHWLEAFTVMEEAHGAERQRILMWPRVLNLFLKDKYKANVPLKHVSHYIDAVLEDIALKRDMKIGFFQIEIPKSARHRFRFMDDKGVVYELHRLPMGHSCSVELCQIIMSVVSGDPAYCLPQYSATKQILIHVWVDGVRAAGSEAIVKKYEEWLDKSAAETHITWNEKDNCTGAKYTFIGVQFDHSAKTVCSKEKCVNRIRTSPIRADMSIGEAEALCGRLRHVSAICGIDIGEHWLFLKILRRRLSALNHQRSTRSASAELPPSAMTDLQRWVDECKANPVRHISATQYDDRWLMYTDSSLSGWGAVLINKRTGEVRVAGGRWATAPPNINPAEVRAVTNGVRAFGHLFLPNSIVDALVDNTSTIAGYAKGESKTFDMNAEQLELTAELKQISVTLRMRYVASKLNLADGRSRE